MPFFTLPTDAVLWPIGPIDPAGEPTLLDPIPIKCRWEEKRSQTVNKDGQMFTIDGTIWVDQVVEEGSVLWKGLLEDWEDTGSQPLMRVAYYEEVPDFLAKETEQTVGVTRFRGKLPTGTPTIPS